MIWLIAKYFIDNFKKHFTSSKPSLPEALDSLLTPVMIGVNNAGLINIADESEIDQTIKQMSSLYIPRLGWNFRRFFTRDVGT